MRGVDQLHFQPDLNKFPFKVVKRSPMEGYSWETDLGIGIIIYPRANKVIPFSRHEVHIETKYGLLFTNGKISVVSISLPITRMKWSGDSLVDAN